VGSGIVVDWRYWIILVIAILIVTVILVIIGKVFHEVRNVLIGLRAYDEGWDVEPSAVAEDLDITLGEITVDYY
jgi:hypothetical protein